MAGFLKKLFGGKPSPDPESRLRRSSASEPEALAASAQAGPARATSGYFAAMASQQTAMRANDFSTAAAFALDGLRLLPGFVAETAHTFGRFDIGSIPCLEEGGRIFALMSDATAQAELARVVKQAPELAPWLPLLDRLEHEQALVPRILETVGAHAGCLQTDLKTLLNEPDGRLIATLVSFLERAGRIARIREGRTYALHLGGSQQIPPPPIPRAASSHRSDSTPPPLVALDLTAAPLITLPRAPSSWEVREEAPADPDIATEFEVRDAAWTIVTLEKLSKSDRPDAAFRLIHPQSGGTLIIDDLGKAGGLGEVSSAAMLYDAAGRVAARAGFGRDLYRIGVHPLGRGFIGMSRDCIVHAYGDDLRPLFETPLAEAPEVITARRRLGIDGEALRNHIRCVGLSRTADRYLFTVVDEAWCVSAEGEGLWGVRFPINAGWSRRASSGPAGGRTNLNAALTLMNLSLPVTPVEIRARYRQLAKQWHPDLNPLDPSAPQRMQALNDACELLTGVDAASLAREAGVRYFREIDRQDIQVGASTVTVTMGFEGGERSAADWIYAASFAAASNGVYLAGYSGRIAMLNNEGHLVRAFDIGAVPRRIAELDGYLYLLTDTRLYVVRGDELHAIVDVSRVAELILSSTGFGLLENKRLRWFTSEGTYSGSLVSKTPIRRVYRAHDTLVVESRQTRCVIVGVGS
ncbi:DnaJ domain-containing protein [Brevundimonas albigilva]|uniref:J domain-containing protein n=1 Tax=Brevundimonas albigilva TaxID=1312364 RepID=UPI00201B76C3|nr:DnaJ domain-containing protein [Brevundimonas albigilva]UQV18962.1 DnaJ domain-containing protein [Brevundimonas albigilva]